MEAEQALVVDTRRRRGLARLSRGDLTCRLTQPFALRYEPLRNDFNEGDGEAAGGHARDHRQRLQHERRRRPTWPAPPTSWPTAPSSRPPAWSQTAAALDQITAAVRSTADGANQANAAAASARAEVERSDPVVTEAVEAMTLIEASSGKIGQIIGRDRRDRLPDQPPGSERWR